MSICHSCLALRVDGEDDDRTRAVLTRWCMKRAGYVSQDSLTDEELLRLPDPRIEDCRRHAYRNRLKSMCYHRIYHNVNLPCSTSN